MMGGHKAMGLKEGMSQAMAGKITNLHHNVDQRVCLMLFTTCIKAPERIGDDMGRPQN